MEFNILAKVILFPQAVHSMERKWWAFLRNLHVMEKNTKLGTVSYSSPGSSISELGARITCYKHAYMNGLQGFIKCVLWTMKFNVNKMGIIIEIPRNI